MNDRFRFRFRAWDEGTKTYFDNAMIETLAPISTWLKNGWIVEQCTGLKDKNGRLIYEGDIVESYGELWKCVFEMNYGYGINSPGFVLKNKFGHAQPFINMQVIGNIHENPELLENK